MLTGRFASGNPHLAPATARTALVIGAGVAGTSVAERLAARGWQAEVLAKAAIVAGTTEGSRLIASIGAHALLVDRHGGLHPTPGFERFTTPRAVPS